MSLLRGKNNRVSSKRVAGFLCLIIGAVVTFVTGDIGMVSAWVVPGVGLLGSGLLEKKDNVG